LLHRLNEVHGQVDLGVRAGNFGATLGAQQELHHTELLVLLLPHGHQLLSLHPALLRGGARIHLRWLLLLQVFQVSKLPAHVASLHCFGDLVVNSFHTPLFHQIRSLVQKRGNVVPVEGDLVRGLALSGEGIPWLVFVGCQLQPKLVLSCGEVTHHWMVRSEVLLEQLLALLEHR